MGGLHECYESVMRGLCAIRFGMGMVVWGLQQLLRPVSFIALCAVCSYSANTFRLPCLGINAAIWPIWLQ